MSGGKERDQAGKVSFVESQSLFPEQHQRIKDRRPGDLSFIVGVKQMARADEVFRQQKKASTGIPDGKCPVAQELGETFGSPSLVRRRDNGDICCRTAKNVLETTEEFETIIQTA